MAVCAALSCLYKAGISVPDGIITATGLGCLEDTEKFLNALYASQEHLLNPTPFIQSTHNTVAGAIAMAVKCHGYNATYTQRGFSIESALLDAMMMISENHSSTILTGSFDELTNSSYLITRRLNLWRDEPIDSLALLQKTGKGSLPGEGLAFFALTGVKPEMKAVELTGVQTLFRPADAVRVELEAEKFLQTLKIALPAVDLVILGLNGDEAGDRYYRHLMNGIFSKTPQLAFKHLCGEYDTSASFALWMATEMIISQTVPAVAVLNGIKPDKIKNIMIYNHLRGINHSFYLLSAC
jgi:3-oxoacyl-[acyl-carrier-protein] synthase II